MGDNDMRLSPELREKVRACKSPQEIIALAKEEGYELSDDQLNAISGGDWDCWTVCSGYDPSQCLYDPLPD